MAQATTQGPSVRSTDCAAAAAIRAVDPAKEYVTSRRAGTSKAWVESTQVKSTAKGPSTVVMSPGVDPWVTVIKNQPNPPMAHRASTGLMPAHGR